MYDIPEYQHKIYLIERGKGIIGYFESLDEVRRAGWLKGRTGKTLREHCQRTEAQKEYFWPAEYTYILRDEFGAVIDPAEVWPPEKPRKKVPLWAWKTKFYQRPAGYRRPVYGSHRKPRHAQEKRWASAWDCEEYPPKVRARRRKNHLPDPWWGGERTAHAEKSWKRHRRKQWKHSGPRRGGRRAL